MTNLKSLLKRHDTRAVLVLALTVAVLSSVLLVAHPLAKNLLIGLAGGPVLWTPLLATGSDPRVGRARGHFRAAAFMVVAFTALLAFSAGPPLSVMFLALVAWERLDANDGRLWHRIVGGRRE